MTKDDGRLPAVVEPDEVVWLRDLDGTGSMHVCTPHDASAVPYSRSTGYDPSDCQSCDGLGVCWNNGDPLSGQWVPCQCGDTRGHP